VGVPGEAYTYGVGMGKSKQQAAQAAAQDALARINNQRATASNP